MQNNSPALFLDRDGVLIEWVHYIQNPKEVRLLPGIEKLLQRARDLGFKIFVLTNQSGIGRGLFGWREYEAVNNRMHELLKEKNVFVDQIYVSPYFSESVNEDGKKGKELRKPEPGMLLLAQREHQLDLKKSVMVGDSSSDIEAGARAGLTKLFFIQNERSPNELPKLKPEWSAKVIFSLDEVALS